MKIIIVGIGELGYHLAKILAQEKHDIVLIDQNADRLQRASESLDVLTLQGSGSRIKTLEKAGAENADMLIAVTSLEEVNLTACLLAARLGTKKKLIRVHDPEFLSSTGSTTPADFGVDRIIYPEGIAAQEIVRLIRRSAATEVLEFAEGKVQLIGLKLDAESPLLNKKLEDVVAAAESLAFRAVCIVRGIHTFIPKRDSVFRKGDQLFVISRTESVQEMLELCGKTTTKFDNIMILGGGEIGLRVAEGLQNDVSVKLLESNKERSRKIAETLSKVMVIQDEGKDLDLLAAEGIMDMDAYIAVSPDEENNIISCLMAKHLGVRKTIAHVEKVDYVPIATTIGIDALVNRKLSAATEILKFIRQGQIVSVATLHGVDAEAIELVAQEGSKVTKKPVARLDFPDGAIIGCVMHNGGVTIPVGVTQIHANDRVVVFTLPRSIHDVEHLFS
jgi:trk system potassium uptake protein TrkA